MEYDLFFKRFSGEISFFIVFVTESDSLIFHLSYFIFAQACPFGISPDISDHLFGSIHRVLEMNVPVFFIDSSEEPFQLDDICEVTLELSGIVKLDKPVFIFVSEKRLYRLEVGKFTLYLLKGAVIIYSSP